jgi:hypothetical protein
VKYSVLSGNISHLSFVSPMKQYSPKHFVQICSLKQDSQWGNNELHKKYEIPVSLVKYKDKFFPVSQYVRLFPIK